MPRRTGLSPDLKERQVNMMAFSSCIGFGLFLQSGIVTYFAGPGLAIIAFLIACSMMWTVVGCLGEMTALWPIQGPLFEFPGRFLDESVGYATGWSSFFGWTITMAAEGMTISQLFRFRFDPEYLKEVGYPSATLDWHLGGYNPAVWVFIFLVIIYVVNMLPVYLYGELEYFCGCLKLTFITGLIIFNVILSGMHATGPSLWTWCQPYGFSSRFFPLSVDSNDKYLPTSTLNGDAGHFVGLWTAINNVMFSLIGFEQIALTAPESRNLERYETVKIASKKLVLRITVLYTVSVFAVGLNVPSDDIYLREAAWSSIHGGQNSMFVLAAVRAGLLGWPSFFNGFFIFSATACAINALYTGSRLLHALASIPEAWPLWAESWRRRLERTTTRGVPLAAVTVSWSIGLLAFMAIKDFPGQVLGRMATNATVCELVTYTVICASYIRFYHCINRAAEDHTLDNRDSFSRESETYPYRTRGQLFRAAYGVVFGILLIVFHGWRAFLTPFSIPDFIVSYIGPVAFCLIVALYHIKLDGWNPFNWQFSASMQIHRPPPKVVMPGRRRGHLEWVDKEWSMANVRALAEWVWEWVQ